MAHWNISLEHRARKLFGPQRVQSWLNHWRVHKLRQAPLLFVHIPKAAGSSISHVISGRRAGHLSAHEMRQALGAAYFDTQFSLAVLREPSERLLSAYYYARQGGGSHGGILPHPDYQSEAFKSPDHFAQHWLPKQLESDADLARLDRVFWPQAAFVECPSSQRCLVNALYRLDQLDQLTVCLSQRLGRRVSIPRRNQTQHQPSSQAPFSASSQAMIKALYPRDYARYQQLAAHPLESTPAACGTASHNHPVSHTTQRISA